MADWVGKLDAFLQFNEYDVLTNAGKVSSAVAKRLAEQQYVSFAKVQDRTLESDFERASRKVLAERKGTQTAAKRGRPSATDKES